MLSLAEVPEASDMVEGEVEERQDIELSYMESIQLLSESIEMFKRLLKYLKNDRGKEGKLVKNRTESILAEIELFIEATE